MKCSTNFLQMSRQLVNKLCSDAGFTFVSILSFNISVT